MRRNTFVFRGTIERNPSLPINASHFITVDGRRVRIRVPKVDGLQFGFVEAADGGALATVGDGNLANVVGIDRLRHLESGGLGPNGRNVGSRAARNALADAI